MRMPARRLIAALFTLTLVAAACGDDDPTTEAVDATASQSADHDAEHDDDAEAEHDHDADHDHDHDSHDDDAMADSDAGHDHDAQGHGEPVDVEGDAVPTIDVEVTADPTGGINVHVETTNYTVAPEAASGEHVEGEGHYHLFIDGERQMRFYNDDIHVAGVTEGEVEVMVELSANDHRPYAVDGVPIVAMTTFAVPAHDHGEHSHGDAELVDWEGPAPELAIEVVEDAKSGYNVFVTVDGMELSADNVNGDHVAGEGHLHIYVNGQKLGRLYGTASHIPVLPDGEVEVSVAAFTNEHQAYVTTDGPIEAVTTVTVAS